MIIHSPTISGSLIFAEGATFTLPDGGNFSGSFSGSLTVHELNSHIIPNGNEIYDLGSSTNRFRDIYLSNNTVKLGGGSIGINDNGEFTLKDNSDNPLPLVSSEIKISDPASGNILVLKSEDGQLKTSATNSSGTAIADPSSNLSGSFTGSFIGDVISTNGVLSSSNETFAEFSSSVATDFGALSTDYNDLQNVPAGIVSSSNQVDLENVQGDTDDVTEGSTNLYFTDARVKTKLNTETVISGSSQVDLENVQGDTDDVTEGSTNLYFTDARATSALSSHTSATDNPHSVTSTQVGLGNVTNESKSTMFSSPTFTGTVIAPTPADNDNSTKVATTAFVMREVGDLIGGAPAAFDTLSEISASIANGDSDVVALTATVSGKLTKSDNLSDLTDSDAALSNLGLTATATELNILDGVTTSTAELNILDGVTATTTELNYVDGVTSNIQTQLNSKQGNLTAGSGISISSGTISNTITNNNQLTNGAGYITGFDITTQTDSKYLRSDTNDTTTGVITLSNSTASTSKTTGALIVTGGVGVSGALNVGGDVVAYASSDRRLKDNIVNIENPIEKVQKLNGVTWDWNGNADELQQSLPNVGVIAQEVEEVFPQLVHDRDNGYKGVDYAKLTGLLIEAVKEQQNELAGMHEVLNAQQKEIEALISKNNQ